MKKLLVFLSFHANVIFIYFSGGGMSPPTFSTSLEADLVQKVGTKLVLQVAVEPDSNGGKVS